MHFTPGQHKDHGLPYNPFKSLVVPRPIGWISTLDKQGRGNIGPYSFYNALSDAPPVVFFSSNGTGDKIQKDSQVNAEETGSFVVNLATYDLRDAMNETCAPLPHGESEAERAGLTLVPSEKVGAPRIAQAHAALECRYLQTLRLPSTVENAATFVVFGEVVSIYIEEAYLTDGRVDILKLKPISRLGYMDYAVVDSLFQMNRPES